jgi:hypothetical protein
MTSTYPARVFLDPPTDAVALYPHAATIISAGIFVASLIFGVVYTYRTRSPLFFWAMVSGSTLYPMLVEPSADWFVATVYPANHDIVWTLFGRDMPWFAVFGYGGGIPVVTVAAWEIIKRGLPATKLLQLLAVVIVIEVPGEMIASQIGWIHYYGNHAVLFDVPIYCIVQNGGFIAVIAWMLSWLMPHMHGWRWILLPFPLAATLPGYAIVATFPAYIAIATKAGPLLGWSAGILSTILNAAVVVACIYSPPIQRLREQATTRQTVPVG